MTAKEKSEIALQEAKRCEAKARLIPRPFCEEFRHIAAALREIAEDYSQEMRASA